MNKTTEVCLPNKNHDRKEQNSSATIFKKLKSYLNTETLSSMTLILAIVPCLKQLEYNDRLMFCKEISSKLKNIKQLIEVIDILEHKDRFLFASNLIDKFKIIENLTNYSTKEQIWIMDSIAKKHWYFWTSLTIIEELTPEAQLNWVIKNFRKVKNINFSYILVILLTLAPINREQFMHFCEKKSELKNILIDNFFKYKKQSDNEIINRIIFNLNNLTENDRFWTAELLVEKSLTLKQFVQIFKKFNIKDRNLFFKFHFDKLQKTKEFTNNEPYKFLSLLHLKDKLYFLTLLGFNVNQNTTNKPHLHQSPTS